MDKIITDQEKLRLISAEVTERDIEELHLKKRLKVANDHGWIKGCGLAAIQIGIPLRYAWYIYKEKEHELINPEIIMGTGTYYIMEGCLSIPDKNTRVKRFDKIEYMNNGKKCRAKGLRAQIIQHEIDHMDGILNIDNEEVKKDDLSNNVKS